ncbi:MAG: arsenate reductase (azurin) small subunit [Nitrososphaerales archaeon]
MAGDKNYLNSASGKGRGISNGGRPEREFYFKNDPQKKVWKDSDRPDIYYTREGSTKIYQRIRSSELEESVWSKAVNRGASRRNFMKYGIAVVGGVIIGGSAISILQPSTRILEEAPLGAPVAIQEFPRLRVAALSELEEGNPVDFRYPLDHSHNMDFVVKLGKPALGGIGPDGDVVGFNYTCTHMGCPLVGLYNHEYKMMGPCACHFTRFDLTKNGMVILGQATENLPQILLQLEGDDIYAAGILRLIYGFRSNLVDAPPAEGI